MKKILTGLSFIAIALYAVCVISLCEVMGLSIEEDGT